MDPKLFAVVFGTIFIAEMGDKTQLATLLFAARNGAHLVMIFVAATLALAMATLIGVLAGAAVARFVDVRLLSYAAGVGFIAIGVWTIWQAYMAAS